MSERRFRQFLGPSSRHPRACVEMGFPLAEGTYRLAPLEPVLVRAGIRLVDELPQVPLALDEAVARLAGLVLSSHAPRWTAHGSAEGEGWAAIAYPFAQAAASVLAIALDLVLAGSEVPQALATRLAQVGSWLKRVNQIEVWMLAAAEMFGRDSAIVNHSIGIYQVGQGAKGLHFLELGNERDGLTGTIIEKSKSATVETLRRVGLPTTRGVLVSKTDAAAQAIRAVGLPCVVKPVSMARGEGVATGLASEAEVAAAVANALKLSRRPVLVENHVEGYDHRLTVIGDELLWVYRKVPATVTGDGKATVAELIARENTRRAAIRHGTEAYLYQIDPNADLAKFIAGRYRLGLDSVLAKGQRIELAGQANIARGGFLEDVTAHVHPDNRTLAIRTARLFRLEAMGIDFITPDISRSWKEVETAIVEVNRTPGISGMGDASLVHRTFFPNRRSGHIPTVAAIGDAAFRAEAGEAIAAAFARHGLRLATGDYAAEREGARPVRTMAWAPAVETLFLDPEADAAAVLCDPARVEASGFPLQRCDLLLVQDQAPFAADTVLAGKVSAAKVATEIGKLAKLYADPAEGGPLPFLEPGPEARDEFRLKVWRARAMPRAWFWREAGAACPFADGMTTHEDLLAAVQALAGLPREFAHGEVIGPWFRVTFEATIPLPARNKDKAREALNAAVARVNAICAAKID